MEPAEALFELPAAPVLLVGPQLSSAFRPMARDLADQLAPKGTSDLDLEAACEALILSRNDLLEERLQVENRVGITTSADGYLLLEGPRLPRDGLAQVLKMAWFAQRSSTMIAVPEAGTRGFLRMPGVQLALIHLAGISAQPARGLRCLSTSRVLSLHGGGDLIELDRSQPANAALWDLIEDLNAAGAPRIFLGGDRDLLLEQLLHWMRR